MSQLYQLVHLWVISIPVAGLMVQISEGWYSWQDQRYHEDGLQQCRGEQGSHWLGKFKVREQSEFCAGSGKFEKSKEIQVNPLKVMEI